MKYPHLVQVLVDEPTKNWLAEASAREGQTISEFLRGFLRDARKREGRKRVRAAEPGAEE